MSCAFSSPARTHDSLGLVPFALRTIHAAGRRGSSQADLARSLNRSAAWITRLVDHLEGEDWVSRTPHPSDRRVNMLTLTPSGASALEGFIDQGRAAVLRAFPDPSSVLLGQLKDQLQRISATISPSHHHELE